MRSLLSEPLLSWLLLRATLCMQMQHMLPVRPWLKLRLWSQARVMGAKDNDERSHRRLATSGVGRGVAAALVL